MNKCEKCNLEVLAKGLCKKHYHAQHYQKNRSAPPRKVMSQEDRKAAGVAASRRWRAAHKEANRAASAAYRAKHLEASRLRTREYMREKLNDPVARQANKDRSFKWRESYPDKAASSHRKYYVSNRNEIIEKNKRYREANKEMYLMYGRLYKAKKRASGEYVHPSFIGLLLSEQGAACACCDASFSSFEYHVDHVVPISRGGEHKHENLQLLCDTCNRRKAARSLMQFLEILRCENV